MRFEKWQALGNDYIVVEAEALPWELTAERIRRICEPHFGVGSDGILLLSEIDDDRYVAELRIFNPDGSEAELSGNGAREAVLYLREAGWTDEDRFTITTKAGEVTPTIIGPGEVSMEHRPGFGDLRLLSRAARRTAPARSAHAGASGAFQHVDVGNPQCVVEVGDELEELDLAAIGPAIESHSKFPQRTNVSFTSVDGSRVRARIFERGVGETLSSGTGASGAAVAAFLRRRAEPDHGRARRRRARRSRSPTTRCDADRDAPRGLRGRARRELRRRTWS